MFLVEGLDERRVLEALGLPNHACVRPVHGRSKFVADAISASKDPNFWAVESIGVVLDAEDDPKEARELALRTLAVLGFEDGGAGGRVGTEERRKKAFFVLPDERSPGSLEGVVRRAAPDEPWRRCADQWEACVGGSRSPAHRDKAWLRVAAAALSNPSDGWPRLLERLDLGHPSFDALREFVATLV